MKESDEQQEVICLEAERAERRPRPISPADAIGYLDLVEAWVNEAVELLDSNDVDLADPTVYSDLLGKVAGSAELLAACLPLLRVTHPRPQP